LSVDGGDIVTDKAQGIDAAAAGDLADRMG
jgi:hypothetical protein